MGIEAFFRKVCKKLCPDAFYPQNSCEWPCTKDEVTVMIDDINSRVRAYPLCMTADSELKPYGCKTWREILDRLQNEYLKYFSQGVKTIVVVFDGNVPMAKETEQKKRKDRWNDKVAKDQIKPYQWPTVESIDSDEFRSQRWFRDFDKPEMGFNDIYYHETSKIQWINYLTEFIATRMLIPIDCHVIVDNGVFKNVKLDKPILICNEFVGKIDMSNLEDSVMLEGDPHPKIQNADDWIRKVTDLNNEPPYWTYGEADDRLIYWVYYFAESGVIVCSEDGDTLISLMATYRSRAQAHLLNRLYMRRLDHKAKLIDGTPVKQTQIIDINRLADFINTLFSGLIVCGLQRILHRLPDNFEVDGTLLFANFVLLRDNDYSSGLTGIGPINIFRAAMNRPDLCAKMLICQSHDNNSEGSAKFGIPLSILIQFDPFERFIKEVYDQGYTLRTRKDGKKRPDIYAKSYPVPPNEEIRASAARLSWTLNKLCNGGRPKYQIPFELMKERGSELSIFGYAAVEVNQKSSNGAEKPDTKLTDLLKDKTKREIIRTKEVVKRVYYGSRHKGLTTIPFEDPIGMFDNVREREATIKEAERKELELKEKERADQIRKEKQRAYNRERYRQKAELKRQSNGYEYQPNNYHPVSVHQNQSHYNYVY